MQNQFIRPAGKAASPAQPAQPRRMVEELSTQTFEFPHARGEMAHPTPAAAPTQSSLQPVSSPVQAVQATSTPSAKPYAEVDPAYVSIDLPSRFQFYPGMQTLSCRTLLAAHQAKFSRAAKEGRLRYAVEALSATLEPTLSAFDLSPGDFYFLMYWQRVNSFSKMPMLITAWCDNEKHNEEVHIGTEVDDEENPGQKKVVKKDVNTLKTEVMMNQTTLDTKYADIVDVSYLDVVKKFNLSVETMRDVVEASELLQDDDTINEEQIYLLKYAPFLRTAPGQSNIKEKMAVAATMSADDLIEMDEYIKVVSDYGVSEYANIKCKECGSMTQVKIALDPLAFLPERR